jgi:hypothetical protein
VPQPHLRALRLRAAPSPSRARHPLQPRLLIALWSTGPVVLGCVRRPLNRARRGCCVRCFCGVLFGRVLGSLLSRELY